MSRESGIANGLLTGLSLCLCRWPRPGGQTWRTWVPCPLQRRKRKESLESDPYRMWINCSLGPLSWWGGGCCRPVRNALTCPQSTRLWLMVSAGCVWHRPALPHGCRPVRRMSGKTTFELVCSYCCVAFPCQHVGCN